MIVLRDFYQEILTVSSMITDNGERIMVIRHPSRIMWVCGCGCGWVGGGGGAAQRLPCSVCRHIQMD
ncbi:hypothetical protein DCAR_0104111 [Daucus carota subsp. sativus]|uniref:Uncharacterized protein n=1 Tax=Daucus carota subsp. sativus TaxID=79200 RepID=A0AAF0W9X3_DAUCS|nr:hypothetical protein DCAR_0104111 [Daucus carota subsp. sativus]